MNVADRPRGDEPRDDRSDLPPYDTQRLLSAPFPERVRLVCRTWASQVYPNPPIVLVMYWAKYLLLFVAGFLTVGLTQRSNTYRRA